MGDESGWRLAPLAMYGEDAGEDDMSMMMMAMPDLEPTGAKGGGGGGKSRGRSRSKPAKSNKRAASRSKSRGNKAAKKQQKQQKKALSRSKSQERKAKKQQQKQQQKERSRSKSQERKAKKQQDKERSRSKSQERKAKKEQQKQQQKERSRSKSQERKAKKQQDKERSRSKSQERKAKKQQDKERSRSKSQERKLSRSKSRESKAAAKQQKKQARSKSRDSDSGSSAADKRGRSRSKSQDKTNAKKNNNNKQDKERSRSKKKDKKKDKEEQSEGDAGDQDDDRSNKKRRASKSRSRSRGRGSGGGGGGGFSGPPGGGSRSGSSGSGSGGGNGGTSNNNNDTNDYQQQQQQQYPYAQPQPPPQYIYQQGNAPAAPPTGPIIVSAGVPQPTPAPTIIVAQPQQPQRQRQIIQVAVPSSSTEVENAKPGDLITVRVPPPGERLVINSTAAAIPDAQGLRILDNPDVLLAGLAPSKELTALQRSNYIEAFIAHKQAMRNPTQRAALSRRIAHSLNDQNAWDNLVDNYLTRNGVGDDPNEPAGTVAKIKYEARQLAQLAMTTTSVAAAAAATTDSVSMNPTKRGASYQEPPAAAPAAAPTLTPSERKRDSQPRDPRTGRYEVAPKVAALKSTATAAFAENAEIRCQSTQNHLGHCADYREVHIYGAEHSGVDLWNVHRLLTVEGAEKAMVAISAIREIRNETFPVDGTIGADGKASDNFLQIATIYENRGSVVSRPGWVIPFVQSAPERAATFKIGSETLQAVTRQYRPRDPSGKKPSWEGALMNAEGRSVPLRLHLASPITAALKGAGTQKIGLDVHVFVPSRRDLDPRGKGTPPTEVFGFIPYANLHIEPDPTGWTPIVWALVRIKFDKEGKLDRVHVTVVTPDVLPRDPDADTTLVISTNGFWYRHRALGEHHLTPGGSPAWVCDYVPLVSGNQHPDEPNPTGARILGVRIGRDSSTKKDPVAKATEGEQHHLEDLASVNAKLRDLGVVGVELSDVLEKVWISPVSGEMSPITNISLIAKEKAAVEPVKVQSLAYKPVGGSIKTHFKSRDIATKGVEGSLTRVADEHAATADLRILALRNLPKQNLVQLTSNNHNGFQLELTFDPTAANARSWALVPRTIRLDGPEKDLRKVFSDKYLAAIVDHHPAPPFVVVVGQDMDKSPGDIKHLDKSAQLVNIWILYSGNT